jgi:mono/diheme cytochrome c family protein
MRRFAAAAVVMWLPLLWLPASAGSWAASAARQTAPPTPTFTKDVAPILYANCVSCHRPGEAAPMSLLTHEIAQAYAPKIKAMVTSRQMPPWFADPQFGEFRNKRALTDAQIATVSRWADGGTPRGDGELPKPPQFREGWSTRLNRNPDLVLELPFEYEVPAAGEVPTFTTWVKLPIDREEFVQALELRPTNFNVVHHSSIALANTLPNGTRLGSAPVFDGGPSLPGVPIRGDGSPFRAYSPEEFGAPILFYVPGGGVAQFPDGLAKRLRPGQYLAWGLHLRGSGKVEKTRFRLGLWYTRRDVHHEVYTWTVNQRRVVDGRELPPGAAVPNIPPNAANWAMTGMLTFDQDVTLYNLWPHMHYRGKDMRFELTTPDGKKETLLNVPHYNPHWQLTYELAKPLRIKAKSTLTAYGHYDNSAANHHNPDPNQEVVFGPQGYNEMFIPFIEVSVDRDDIRYEQLLQSR